jgi:hypothetical protein
MPSPHSKRFARPILRTQAQVDRAQRIHDEYVEFRIAASKQVAKYPKRAFMGPALETAKPKLPSLWTETETVVEINESDLLQECEINICIVDEPMDGDELLDEQEAFVCDLTFEISTGPTKSCQLFTGGPVYSMTQDYVEVFHQGISQGPLDTAMLLVGQHVNHSVPFGFNFTGSTSLCLGFRVIDFETTVDCVLSGDATYVIAPSMEVTIEQA